MNREDAIDLAEPLSYAAGESLVVGVIVVIVGVVVAALLLPVLLLVAEIALVFALVAPLLLTLGIVGLRRHSVVAACEATGETLVRPNVRFLWQSRSIQRAWAEQLSTSGTITDAQAVRPRVQPPVGPGPRIVGS